MRLAAVLFMLLLMPLYHAEEICVPCEQFADRPQANIILLLDEENSQLEANVYYENLTATPSRLPVARSGLVVELSNTTDLRLLYKMYANDEGKAVFDYSNWAQGCVNFRVLYCPFCDPEIENESCGFLECMNFASMPVTAGTYEQYSYDLEDMGDIADAPGTSYSGPITGERYLPNIATYGYCPPPPPEQQTPALCLPLAIVFSLLAGSLYMTGRNPFAGFNIGGARIGRHIRYQARGRGFHLDAMSVVRAAQSIKGAGKAIKEKGLKEGLKGIAAKDAEAAKGNVFLVSGIMRAKKGISELKTARKLAAKMKAAPGEKMPSYAVRLGRALDYIRAGEGGGAGGAVMVGDKLVSTGGGEGGVRISELVVMPGEGISKATAILKSVGKIALFGLTQSRLGSMINGIYNTATGKSLANTLFVNHSKRLQNDMTVVAAMAEVMRGENGGVMTQGIEVMRAQPVVNAQTGQPEGTTFSISFGGVPSGGRVSSGGLVGNIGEVTTDKTNQVVEVSYRVGLPASPGGEPIETQVVVRLEDVKGQMTPVAYKVTPGPVSAAEKGAPAPTIPTRAEDQAAALQPYNENLKTAHPQLGLGSDISSFMNAHNDNMAALASINETLGSLRNEIQLFDERMKEATSGPGSEAALAPTIARDELANEVFGSMTGARDEDTLNQKYLGAGGPASTTGVVQSIASQSADSFNAPAGSASQSLALDMTSTAKLPEADANLLSTAAQQVLAGSTVGNLAQMNADSLKNQVSAVLSDNQVDRDTINRISSAITPQTAQVASQASGNFLNALREEQNFRPALADEYRNATLGTVDQHAGLGARFQSGEQMSFIAENPRAIDHLPEQAKQEVREYGFLQATEHQLQTADNALNRQDFPSMWKALNNAVQRNTDYVDAAVINISYQEKIMNANEYRQAAAGMNDLANSFRLERSMAGQPEEIRSALRDQSQSLYNSGRSSLMKATESMAKRVSKGEE